MMCVSSVLIHLDKEAWCLGRNLMLIKVFLSMFICCGRAPLYHGSDSSRIQDIKEQLYELVREEEEDLDCITEPDCVMNVRKTRK